MNQERSDVETWDLSWMGAALQSLETYEAALETTEFSHLLLAALDELLENPEVNAAQLQELTDVLLRMIEFPIDLELPQETVTKLHSTRDWAIQTLLDIHTEVRVEDLLQYPTMSESLQQMQSKLFVSAPCRDADVEMELHQSLLAAVKSEEESDTLSDVLELSAEKLHNDTQFLHFAEIALSGKTESLRLGSFFLRRLVDRRSEHQDRHEQRLFDALTLRSKVRVWANHLPSWRLQLQTWMLATHRAPFEPISSVLPDGWCFEDDLGAHSTVVVDRYSHLYVIFIEWCRCHVDLLSSCRSMELVTVISRSIRQEDAPRLFGRQLLNRVPLMNCSRENWSCDHRERTFLTLGNNLEHLQKARSASDLAWKYEWIGVLERSHLLHEALELTFSGTKADMNNKGNVDRSAARSSIEFFSWFYSFSASESAEEIALLLTTISSELKVSDVRSGAQWLRRSRADFSVLPILRLRLVWFWLLKSIGVESRTLVSVDEVRGATIDVLESIEYIFRRFTPPQTKRPFQVELVTQLLVELEWRATNTRAKAKDAFLNAIEPVCAWLTKIVRLMQLEELTVHQKDSRNGYSNGRTPVNDVQHLSRRIERFVRGNKCT